MAIPATTAAANVAGAHQAAQTVAKAAPKREPRPANAKRADDELLLNSTAVEGAEAVRDLRGNSEEEAREDRQEHPAYAQPDPDDRPRLDVSG